MRWMGQVALVEDRRGIHRFLVGTPEGKKSLGRLRLRWKDYIKMDLQEVGCGCMDWIELAQDRDRWWALVNMVMNEDLCTLMKISRSVFFNDKCFRPEL